MALGSTADHLLQHPPAPLVVAYTPDPVTRVVVCTDGSASAEGAVAVLAGLPLTKAAERIAVIGVATVGMYDDRDEVFAGFDRAVAMLGGRAAERHQVACDEDPCRILNAARRVRACRDCFPSAITEGTVR